MQINVERLSAVLEYIRTHPEEWDQNEWATQSACGTAYCAAGTTLHLDGGYDFMWRQRYSDEGDARLAAMVVRKGMEDEVGNRIYIDEEAARLLGFNSDKTVQFFAGYNTLPELYEMANLWTNGAIAIPDAYKI